MIVDERTTEYAPPPWPMSDREHDLHIHYASNALAVGHRADCETVTSARNWPRMDARPDCTCEATTVRGWDGLPRRGDERGPIVIRNEKIAEAHADEAQARVEARMHAERAAALEDSAVDIELTRDGELMVVQVEGKTDAGVEFVDGYQSADLVVVDSGRVILPEYSVTAPKGLVWQAREHGLTVEETER